MIYKLKEQWFLVSLAFIFLAVIYEPFNILSETGIFLKNHHGPEFMIFMIFMISGLVIENTQVRAGIRDIKATALALVLILVAAPLAARVLSLLPMETGVALGFFIVAAMPTTLSSGVVMTGAAGGNMAHALFVTILSNFIAIFSIPVVLSFLLSCLHRGGQFSIDQYAIVVKLFFLVVLPLVTGMAMKNHIFRNRKIPASKLQIVNQCFVIAVVFISISGAKDLLLERTGVFFYIVLLAAVFHLMLLCASFCLVKLFGIERGRMESIVFMGSQKTLPLSLVIQVTYFPQFGAALLVCVIHHVVHLMIDGCLSTEMGRSGHCL
jgi:sodium/bile acid cotransporter 7